MWKGPPKSTMEYKHAIVLHNIYNNQIPKDDWVDLNFNQILTSRQTKFQTLKSNNFKVVNNKLISRLATLNGKITLSDLNLSLDSFKCKYKKLLLSPWSYGIPQNNLKNINAVLLKSVVVKILNNLCRVALKQINFAW